MKTITFEIPNYDSKNIEENPITNSVREIHNCNGQYFNQDCVKCGLLLKIWCTEWKACPKCGTKNYGRHYGA